MARYIKQKRGLFQYDKVQFVLKNLPIRILSRPRNYHSIKPNQLNDSAFLFLCRFYWKNAKRCPPQILDGAERLISLRPTFNTGATETKSFTSHHYTKKIAEKTNRIKTQ